MKRLTALNKNGQAYYPECFKWPCLGAGHTAKCNTCGYAQKVADTLAAYENTGLTPADVELLKQAESNLADMLDGKPMREEGCLRILDGILKEVLK